MRTSETMDMMITVETFVKTPLDKVWKCWIEPGHITQWNFASEEWCCPTATNDLRPGGSFLWRMEAKDGTMGFDFTGTYDEIEDQKSIKYRITDGRKVIIDFSEEGNATRVRESFEAEGTHSEEQQRAGWEAILKNFKKYVESTQ